jgi:hypothetical protein
MTAKPFEISGTGERTAQANQKLTTTVRMIAAAVVAAGVASQASSNDSREIHEIFGSVLFLLNTWHPSHSVFSSATVLSDNTYRFERLITDSPITAFLW